jgi:16S rRNA C967 or C1407 C5-methylase (RsmB/RsmF family)
MKHHFDYKSFPGVSYELPKDCKEEDVDYQRECIDLVQDLDETLREFQVKLSAAYARLRIERQASGENFREQMENILPEDVKQKEEIAIDMPKTLRINSLKTNRKEIEEKLRKMGYSAHLVKFSELREEQQEYILFHDSNIENVIYLDDDFEDLLIIPSRLLGDLKSSTLVEQGYLIFQDKASVYCTEQLKSFIQKGDHIIDARAGCGTKLPKLSALVGKNGHIFAFENRPGRLETLKSHLVAFGCNNVTVIEEDFSTVNVRDEQFSKVSTVLVEPMNSGTTIVDKLGFMLQEEEYPVDTVTLKDLLVLKRQQVAMLKHAFKFPKVKNILYQTRSVHSEENEKVVNETLERWGVEWKLNCVLPDVSQDEKEDTIEECLTIEPSTLKGNGIFIAHFQLKPKETKKPEAEKHRIHTQQTEEMTVQELEHQLVEVIKPKRKKKERKRGEPLKIKLPKQLRYSVDRLSVPRSFVLDQKEKEIKIKKESSKFDIVDSKFEKKTTLKVFEEAPTEVKQKDANQDLDVAVYGISLSKFYGPRALALQELNLKKVLTKPKRWIYPVLLVHNRFPTQPNGSNVRCYRLESLYIF